MALRERPAPCAPNEHCTDSERLRLTRVCVPPPNISTNRYEEDCDELLDHGVAEIFDASSLAYLYDM